MFIFKFSSKNSNIQFCPIFQFCPILSNFSILSNFQFCPTFQVFNFQVLAQIFKFSILSNSILYFLSHFSILNYNHSSFPFLRAKQVQFNFTQISFYRCYLQFNSLRTFEPSGKSQQRLGRKSWTFRGPTMFFGNHVTCVAQKGVDNVN